MTDKENVSISFEGAWKSLEEQDKTGVYKRAREMAGIAREQLEYAFNYGYETAKAKYDRPTGEWIIVKDERHGDNVKCPFCGKELAGTDLNFCCKCGAELTGSEKMNGGAE